MYLNGMPENKILQSYLEEEIAMRKDDYPYDLLTRLLKKLKCEDSKVEDIFDPRDYLDYKCRMLL